MSRRTEDPLSGGTYFIIDLQYDRAVRICNGPEKSVVSTTERTDDIKWTITRLPGVPPRWSIGQRTNDSTLQFSAPKPSSAMTSAQLLVGQPQQVEWIISRSPSDNTAYRIHREDSGNIHQWILGSSNDGTIVVIAQGLLNFHWRIQQDGTTVPPIVTRPTSTTKQSPGGGGSRDNDGTDIGAEINIPGISGAARVFGQASDGSIYIKGWQPNRTPWPTKTLVPKERVRKPTPLAALCWGGDLGFKQIRVYYVDNRDVLQEILLTDGSSSRPGGLGSLRLRVSRQSKLVANRIGGERAKVRFRSMRGARRFAAEIQSGGGWRVVWDI